MPRNDREIWLTIISDPPGAPELNYLTYAIYSFEKYEWYGQIEKQRGNPPTPVEIDEWISQITEFRIKAWRENAARTFDVAARTYMQDEFSRERQHFVDDHVITSVNAVLASVKRALAFRNQLFTAFVIAILSPVILGLIILSIQAADLWPTASGLSHFFRPHDELPGAVQKP